jgi:hypothetical protein
LREFYNIELAMRIEKQLEISASDLAKHLGCRHLTSLELRAARVKSIGRIGTIRPLRFFRSADFGMRPRTYRI